ncbi:MAG: hypothetical protein DRP06_03810 [Candidatus Aenigmatarchaeota archaeon]|nr:MAG: hypothetical protein DRP06_03810 [Candidatus Aenigmarchaeota archaeon]
MDYGEKIKVILLPAIIFVVFVLLDYLIGLTVIVHEFGHAFTCNLIGGKILNLEAERTGGKVECYFGREIESYKLVIFYLAGILAELTLALIFLAIPYTSHIGGYLTFMIGWSWFFGSYAKDFEIIPFLLIFPVRFLVLVLSVVVYIISWIITFRYWEKL